MYVAAGVPSLARTFTVIVQDELAGILPFASTSRLFKVAAGATREIVIVSLPLTQVVTFEASSKNSRLSAAGARKVSVNDKPVYGMLAMLVMVIVIKLTPPAAMGVVANDLVSVNA